jgi:hypothetical protein
MSHVKTTINPSRGAMGPFTIKELVFALHTEGMALSALAEDLFRHD